ncbi:MAG: AI-2E family transporter [Candidatus Velthaea sp.]
MSPAAIRRLIFVLAGIALAVVLVLFIARIPRTVSVFLIAGFIAFGAMPLVRRLQMRMPRPAAIALVYSGLLGAMIVIALVVVPVTYGQLAALIARAPDYVAASQDLVGGAERLLRVRLGNRVPLPSVADLQVEVGNRVAGTLSGAFTSIGTIVLGIGNALFVGISALILSVFFVSRGKKFGNSLLEFVPPRKRVEVNALFDEIASIFGHFVAGQAFLCAIVGVAVWLALVPAHFGFALLIAVICAVGYAVPFVGMIVAQVIAAVLAIPQGSTMVIYVSVAIFIIARVADNVLVPKVMSESVGVSPIGVMFAVFAGGELFGLAGLLLGIPAAALFKVLFKYFVQPYVVRMQIGDVASHFKPTDVHVAVDVDTPEGTPPPESVVVAIRP